MVDHIVTSSIEYARQSGNHNFQLSREEVKLYLAILFTSGHVPLPRRRMYWEQSSDVNNMAISTAMTVNRFDEIMRYLHVADNNNLDANDKLAKVRPLFTLLNERFLEFYPMEENLSVDESMVPYYGRHSAKQFIRGKPVRFGYKMWCLNTRLGYLIQCEPYQGAGQGGQTYPHLGLGGSVVVDLISELPEGNHYKIHADNFFTSLKLLDHLTDEGIGLVGTIRANRIENCPIRSTQQMKKENRGSVDYLDDTNSGNIVVRWNDNSVVTLISNCVGVLPIAGARRWSRAEGRYVNIPQPKLVASYNTNMGGVDRMDQNVGQYRISIRSKKWWWPLFAVMPDIAIQNAWLLYRMTPSYQQKKLDLLAFRREIANVYFRRYSVRQQLGRHIDHHPCNDLRYDGLDHVVVPCEKQRRCASCPGKAKTACRKCNVGLHARCFVSYHTRP